MTDTKSYVIILKSKLYVWLYNQHQFVKKLENYKIV